jgi:molecular chaperone DnaK
MVKDAESHAEEDAKKRESVETKNMAENVVYQTEKLIKEQGDKVPDEKKRGVESAIEDLKAAIKSDSTDEMKAKMEALNTQMQAISADLYAQAGPEAGGEGGPAPEGEADGGEARAEEKKDEDGDVIDADFEMVDDDKK